MGVPARLAALGHRSVVDLGCGTGENALFLASRGLRVTGIDAAPTAIGRASGKARQRGIVATFRIADALELGRLGASYDAALDCGLFHTFSDEERVRYERGLRQLVVVGGRCFILCFSDRQPGGMGPRRVSQAELRATFARGWRVDAIEETAFATHDEGQGSRAPLAWLASLTRLAEG
jgi:cyclopropane fatty-acyl-phospholipid synthase-like methyltransferase